MGSMGSPQHPRVAFIGLGAMGFAMSTHLVRVGFEVKGYDVYGPTNERWSKTCSEIPNSRYSVASSPADCVKDAEVVCLMVANHYHIHSALFDSDNAAAKALPKGISVIINATIPPTQPAEIRKRLTEESERQDVTLLDCPVSGGTAGSKNGTLTIMASAEDLESVKQPHVFAVLSNLSDEGKKLYPIPGGLGAGESAKALNQVQCGIHIVSASEIMGLAAILGVDTKSFFDQIATPGSQGWSWMLANRGPRMLTRTPEMSSATAIIDKDVGIIRDEEKRVGCELKLLNLADDQLKKVMATPDKAEDDSVIVKHYLGRSSERENLVVDNIGKQSADSSMIEKLMACHAVIHLRSSYETVKFGQELDLMGPEQKKQWYSIISGAAGASTTFSTVVPLALKSGDGVEAAFKKYAVEKMGKSVLDTAVSSPATRSPIGILTIIHRPTSSQKRRNSRTSL